MSAQCVMGNTICMYAVKTGRPDVIEAIFNRFPSDEVIRSKQYFLLNATTAVVGESARLLLLL